VFASQDKILWLVALPMAAAQLTGGVIGARTTMKVGKNLVRRAMLVVVAALVAKLLWDMFGG
jgi:uncharacterized membrane protein YfcA